MPVSTTVISTPSTTIRRVSPPSRRCSGVGGGFAASASAVIAPISARGPVAVTIALSAARASRPVPASARDERSASGAPAGTGSGRLVHGDRLARERRLVDRRGPRRSRSCRPPGRARPRAARRGHRARAPRPRSRARARRGSRSPPRAPSRARRGSRARHRAPARNPSSAFRNTITPIATASTSSPIRAETARGDARAGPPADRQAGAARSRGMAAGRAPRRHWGRPGRGEFAPRSAVSPRCGSLRRALAPSAGDAVAAYGAISLPPVGSRAG